MRVFDIIKLLVPDLQAAETKVHLATWNGVHDPLDVFPGRQVPAVAVLSGPAEL
jgi:hypothetical protein